MSTFVKKTWETGETISADKLNRMEEGISEAITEAGKKAAGSGWNADKYLGTDENGNVVEKEPPEAADGPVTVDENGYTDISGLRGIESGSVVRSGQTVTITANLQGGVADVVVLNFDEDDYPTTITANGVTSPWTWEGF